MLEQYADWRQGVPKLGDPISWYYTPPGKRLRSSHTVYGRVIKLMNRKVRIRFYDYWDNRLVERDVYPRNLYRADEEDVGRYDKYNALASAEGDK